MKSESEEELANNEQEGQPGTVPLVDFIEASQRRDALPGATERRERERMFLQTRIFADLVVLKPSWESDQINHFNRIDFLTVLDRCSEAGVEVFGVEVFSRDGILIGINIPISPTDPSHRNFVRSFPDQPRLSFGASYGLEGVSLENVDDKNKKQ